MNISSFAAMNSRPNAEGSMVIFKLWVVLVRTSDARMVVHKWDCMLRNARKIRLSKGFNTRLAILNLFLPVPQSSAATQLQLLQTTSYKLYATSYKLQLLCNSFFSADKGKQTLYSNIFLVLQRRTAFEWPWVGNSSSKSSSRMGLVLKKKTIRLFRSTDGNGDP